LPAFEGLSLLVENSDQDSKKGVFHMAIRRCFVLLMIALLLCSLAGTGCKQEVKLGYNLPKDDVSVYKLKIITDEHITLLPDNKNISGKQTFEAEVTQKVTNIDKDGNLTVEMTYNNLKQVVEADGKTQEIPTGKNEGKSVSMKMSKLGKILDYQTEDDNDSSENLKQLGQMNAVFPAKPLAVGASWDDESEQKLPFPKGMDISIVQKIKNNYKLEALEKLNKLDCAKISLDSTITRKLEKGAKAAKVPIENKGQGELKGTLYFGVKKGKIVKTEMKSTMNGTATVPVAKDKTQKISTKSETTMTMELIK
jgi:hypothetical protein